MLKFILYFYSHSKGHKREHNKSSCSIDNFCRYVTFSTIQRDQKHALNFCNLYFFPGSIINIYLHAISEIIWHHCEFWRRHKTSAVYKMIERLTDAPFLFENNYKHFHFANLNQKRFSDLSFALLHWISNSKSWQTRPSGIPSKLVRTKSNLTRLATSPRYLLSLVKNTSLTTVVASQGCRNV